MKPLLKPNFIPSLVNFAEIYNVRLCLTNSLIRNIQIPSSMLYTTQTEITITYDIENLLKKFGHVGYSGYTWTFPPVSIGHLLEFVVHQAARNIIHIINCKHKTGSISCAEK